MADGPQLAVVDAGSAADGRGVELVPLPALAVAALVLAALVVRRVLVAAGVVRVVVSAGWRAPPTITQRAVASACHQRRRANASVRIQSRYRMVLADGGGSPEQAGSTCAGDVH
eukprot:6199481-Pleurochrysis_carterae.AAC.1